MARQSINTPRERSTPSIFSNLEAEALTLPVAQRAQLADRLLASLAPDPSVDEAWAAESLRRLDELESGAVEATTIESAIARARSAIR